MKHLNLSPQLHEYMLQVSLREHPVLQDLRDEQVAHPLFDMQTAPEQAQFIQMLLRLLQAKHVLELGTFMGYTTLAMALVLPEDGHIITCDRNTHWTDIAKPYWQRAKQDHKIDLRIGPALATLKTLVSQGMSGIQPHGLIAVDNVFWNGEVINPEIKNGQSREIRRLNTLIQNDARVEISLIPMVDGLFLIQPKMSL